MVTGLLTLSYPVACHGVIDYKFVKQYQRRRCCKNDYAIGLTASVKESRIVRMLEFRQ